MNCRERVISALCHQEPDWTPYQIEFTAVELEKVIRETGKPDFIDSIGNHISKVDFLHGRYPDPDRPDFIQDDFGVVWNKTVDKDIGVVESYQLPEPDIHRLRLPDIDPDAIRRDALQFEELPRDTFRIGKIGFSLFERAWTLRGMENLLFDMVSEPTFVHDLLEAICDLNLKVIDLAVEQHFDGFYFGDDWGSQKGMIMGPNHWRTFIKPRLARMYSKVKDSGKFVLQHSCGDIEAIFPDLIDIGLDVYQTFQPEIYDIADIKKRYGSNLAFWGAISTQHVLSQGTPEEVRETTRRTMDILGQQGGYIAGPTHSVPGDVPTANILAMLEVFQNQ